MRKLESALRKLIVSVVIISLFPVQLHAFTNEQTERISGSSSFDTANQIAQKWTSSTNVILAPSRQENLTDALAAGPLAVALNAPMLLTDGDSLTPETIQQLENATTVYIVSGTGVIKEPVRTKLRKMGKEIVDAWGMDAPSTSVAIAKELQKIRPFTEVVLANARIGTADAVSISPFAGMKNIAILVTNDKDTLPTVVSDYLGTHGNISKRYVVGGTGVISDRLNSEFGGTRLAGRTAYDTNYEVIKTFAESYKNIYLVARPSLAEGLVAAPLASKQHAPLILTDGKSIAPATVALVNSKLSADSVLTVVGDASFVPQSVTAQLSYQSNQVEVQSVNPVGLTMLQIRFTQAVDAVSAKNLNNYQYDAQNMPSGTFAYLESDARTVSLFLPKQEQGKTAQITVKDVLEASGRSASPTYKKSVTFLDTTVPQLLSAVSLNGNITLQLTFNEPVAFNGEVAGTAGSPKASNFSIDGWNLGSVGVASIDYNTILEYRRDPRVVTIQLNNKLNTGTHTLRVENTVSNYVRDAANYPLINGTVTFDTSDNSLSLTVTESVALANGKVYLTFNKELATNSDGTIKLASGYRVNGTNMDYNIKWQTDASGNPIKSKIVIDVPGAGGQVIEGTNTITVPKGQTDSYGYVLSTISDLTLTVTGGKDLSSPYVTQVYAANDQNIYVRFNKSVKSAYANDRTNYKLTDRSGSSVYDTNPYTVSLEENNDSLAKLRFNTPLNQSYYNISIMNVQDLSGYVLNAYTGSVSVSDKTQPTLATTGSKAFRSSTYPQTIEVFFSEPMEEASLLARTSYLYSDPSTTHKELASGTTLIAGEYNKSVKITFPSGTDASKITDLRAIQVKDLSGNVLQNAFADTGAPQSVRGLSPNVVAGSAKLYADSNKAWLTFQTTRSLLISPFASLNFPSYFLTGVSLTNSLIPATVNGNTVTLTWTNANDITYLKNAGSGIYIASGVINNATDAYGDALSVSGSSSDLKVVDNIAPILSTTQIPKITSYRQIIIYFNENLNSTSTEYYKNDFTVTTDGAVNPVQYTSVSGNTLTLTVANQLNASTTVLKASPNSSIKDVNGNYYQPSQVDKDGIRVTN